jgi:protease IV
MQQFFKFVFASCLGSALGLLLLSFLGFSMLAGLAGSAAEAEKVTLKPNSVLELKFEQPIPDKTNNLPMDPFALEQKDVLGLTDMVKMIRKAKEDPDIKGIYINATYVLAGKASSSALREALLDFKSSGKFIVTYANYYTQNAYYIASVADSILLNPVGAVDFRGLSSTITYYKGMLDKLDVEMKVFYAGKFKSATEPYRFDKMSPENRLQVREYLVALNDIMMRDIAAARNIPEADLRRIADNFDGRGSDLAKQARLVDRLAYEDEPFELMKQRIGLSEKEKLNRISIEDYFSSEGPGTDFSVKDKIAVVYAEGTILDGAEGEEGDVYDGKYVKILRQIRKDDKIKAIVLRVNSPGGSVLASENIYREIQLCKDAGKKVVVSMGDVAASGGYYIACIADSIFAQPNTITGSIGVFGTIPMLDKTMKNKLGITYDTVLTGKHSAFGTPFIQFSPEEDRMIQERIERTYEDFLAKVANGRHLTRDQVHEIAQGRVWAGNKAKAIGLVDEIGGLDRAIASAAKLAGIEKYRTTDYPRTAKGLERFLEKLDKTRKDDDAIQSIIVRRELGDMYPIYKSMRDITRTRGIQARLPYEVMIF